MLKGRSKTFVPKKAIRNALCNQRASKKNDEATSKKQEPFLQDGDSTIIVPPNEYHISKEIAAVDVQKKITTPSDPSGSQDIQGEKLSTTLHNLNSKQRHLDAETSEDPQSVPISDTLRGSLPSAYYPTPPTTQISLKTPENDNFQVLTDRIFDVPGLKKTFFTQESTFQFGDSSQVSTSCPDQSEGTEISKVSTKEADLALSKKVLQISEQLILNTETVGNFSPHQDRPDSFDIHKLRSSQDEQNQDDYVRIDPSLLSDRVTVEPENLLSLSSANHPVSNEKEFSQSITNDENEGRHNVLRPEIFTTANSSRDINGLVTFTSKKPPVPQETVDQINRSKESQSASKGSLVNLRTSGPTELALDSYTQSIETPADTSSPIVPENAENVSKNNSSTTPSRVPTAVPSISGNLETAPRKKRKYVKRSRAIESDPVVNSLPDILVGRKERKKTCRRKRMKREDTPEEAETKKIDPSVITMQDLCRDLRIGKKSKNHNEIMGRLAKIKRNAIQAKMRRDHPELSEFLSEEGDCVKNSTENENTRTCNKEKSIPSPPISGTGLRMRIVDGQIVTDEQSLQIDRHKRARENAGDEENVIEENDFTRIVTCSDYMKRERAQHWDLSANELFWKGLRMFGTDFEMIANMFPNRSRRQIKLKFNAEERCNPQKLNRVLMGIKTEAIDLDEFQRLGNLELEDLAIINAEQAQVDKEQADHLEAIEKFRQTEISRKKSEIRGDKSARNLLGKNSDDENESMNNSSKNRKDMAKLKKSRKNMQSIYGGGEEVIVLETNE